MKNTAILSILFLIGACKKTIKNESISTSNSIKTTIEKPTLSGHWELLKVNDTLFDIGPIYGEGQTQPRLTIDTEKGFIGGFSGCNGFGGDAVFGENTITLKESVFTNQLFCGDSKWEDDFYDRIENIQNYTFENTNLKIVGNDGRTMEFNQKIYHPLENHSWELTHVNDSAFVTNNKVKRKPVIKFNFDKNMITGFTGCNGFSMSVLFQGNGYKTIKEPFVTKRNCDKSWSKTFFGILKNNQNFTILDNVVILTDTNGRTLRFKKEK